MRATIFEVTVTTIAGDANAVTLGAVAVALLLEAVESAWKQQIFHTRWKVSDLMSGSAAGRSAHIQQSFVELRGE